MVKKLHETDAPTDSGTPMTGSLKDSAQQIWQAGLGAFAKAQAEGTRAFEALVKEGASLQRKTQTAAQEKISEATSKVAHMATDMSSRASGHWDKLENIFEQRVAKALSKLGVPSAKDINALTARIDELNRSVQKLSSTSFAAAKTRAPKAASRTTGSVAGKAAPKAAAKATAKRAPARKST